MSIKSLDRSRYNQTKLAGCASPIVSRSNTCESMVGSVNSGVIRLAMDAFKSIPDLLDLANAPDMSVAGSACRELLHRSTECHDYIPRLIDLLESSSVVITDLAFRTLERIGQPAVDLLVERFHRSDGEFRRLLLGLIAGISRFDDYYPILQSEIQNGELECRYWAANCLGRNYNIDSDWPLDAIELLGNATQILVSLRNQPEYWAQARITLKHLGRLPNA